MPKRKPKDPERSADMPHHWIERLLDRLDDFAYYDKIDIPSWTYRRSRLVAAGEYEALDTTWQPIKLGDRWGGSDVTGFFKTSIEIPPSHATHHTMLDIFLDGGEAQLVINGRYWQGLDWNRSLVPIGELAVRCPELEIEIEAFVINYPYDERRNDLRDFHTFERAQLLKRDEQIEAFLIDARLILDTYLSYWRSDQQLAIESFLLHHLQKTCFILGSSFSTHDEVRHTVASAHQYLLDNVFKSDNYQHTGKINLSAHAHMDIVYLWQLKETLRKNCRTTTNALNLMREFPEYKFSQSQPYLYEQLKAMYPSVYKEVCERVTEGRWEVIGAMYVEADCNVTGAESLVRQLLFGKRFVQAEFGIDAQTCWLPDVFGMVYTLPQILKKCGVHYFLTNKLNIWNDTNSFPYDTFWWRGLDGSQVLTHFPPTHYAQPLTADNLRRQWAEFRERETVGENVFIYGWADGGGGPTREMVATSMRLKHIPGLPSAQAGKTEDYFRQLEKKAEGLSIWDDELYLEAHRGTYTTKANLKRLNRKAELLYRDAEIIASLASLYGGPYIQTQLNDGWKLLLLNQFHDILPGTHRQESVPDIEQDYETIFMIGNAVRDEAIDFIAAHVQASIEQNLLIFNTLAWKRQNLVEIPYMPDASSVRLADGSQSSVQHFEDKSWVRLTTAPSLGWTTCLMADETNSTAQTVTLNDDNVVRTPFYQFEFTEAGWIGKLYDLVNKRPVLANDGNVFQVFEDDPGRFGAWDIAYHFESFQHPVIQTSPWELASNGVLFAVFRSEWQVLNSTIRQELWLYADSPRIDFHTTVDWQDEHKLLKVAFPLAIRTRLATYDLPFGSIERPTHRNTSWDQAKYEVCGHKWADLSEGNYGVALLNDCKYGYDAHENVLRLSLLRSPTIPDPTSDIGHHEFSYALLPHAGNWRQAQVDRRAYEFNIPMIAHLLPATRSAANSFIPESHSFLHYDYDGLIVEAFKQAEDKRGYILRSFDSHGNHQTVNMELNVSINSFVETDMLENELPDKPELSTKPSAVVYSPYEIKTHRLVVDDS